MNHKPGWWIVMTKWEELTVLYVSDDGYGYPCTTISDRYYQPNQIDKCFTFIQPIDIDELAKNGVKQ